MEEKKEIIIGNTSTIITTISLSLAGLIVGLLSANGLNWNIDQQSLAGVIGLIIMFIFSIVNAKYKSTYFTNTDEIRVNVNGLTSNQIEAIQNFVDNCISKNTVDVGGRVYPIDDIDPASEYEIDDRDGC